MGRAGGGAFGTLFLLSRLSAWPRLALCYAFLVGFAARPLVAALALALALADDFVMAWPPPLSPLVIAAVNGGVLRAWSGWMRAVTVYCVAGAAIVYYLVAKVVNKYVLRLEGAAADVYWERRHTRAAPFVVSRLAALGGVR